MDAELSARLDAIEAKLDKLIMAHAGAHPSHAGFLGVAQDALALAFPHEAGLIETGVTALGNLFHKEAKP